MIFVSDHAFISKWWWIGAIRNTRLPVRLNEITWMITLSASTTNTPPTSGSRSSVFVNTANAATAPPSASEPVSPMNTSAGNALYQRNPMHAPSSAADRIARSSDWSRNASRSSITPPWHCWSTVVRSSDRQAATARWPDW